MTTAREILDGMKGSDGTTAEDVRSNEVRNFGPTLAIVQEPNLARLVSVWENVPRSEYDQRAVCPPDTPAGLRQTRWLWAQLTPDPVSVWIEVAGLPDNAHVRRSAAYAIDNRIVHPDGAVSLWAKVALRTLIAQALDGKGKKK